MSHDLSSVRWCKARRSHQQGECVEVAGSSGIVAIRDSKDPGGLKVFISHAAFRQLMEEIRGGRHNL